jgi:hypothetical protein
MEVLQGLRVRSIKNLASKGAWELKKVTKMTWATVLKVLKVVRTRSVIVVTVATTTISVTIA